MFRMKNSAAKTVPLDPSDRSADLSETKVPSSKSSKWKIQRLFTTKGTNSNTKATPTASFREVPTKVKEIIEETTQGPEQNDTVENRTSFDPANSSKEATCKKRLSFRRKKIDTINTGSGQPGSPDVDVKPKPKPNPYPQPSRNKTAATLTHSVSMPVPTRVKRGNQLTKARVVPKLTRLDEDVRTVNKFDPVVGMSIIVVTLIIMLIWGRFCAVLCTSALLYFVPRLRALKKDDHDDAVMRINGDDLDLNSEEYKKRVVLEGFLDRDHRAVTAVS